MAADTARQTGNEAAITVGAVTFLTKSFKYREFCKGIEVPAGGDAWVHREPGRKDFELTAEGFVPVGTFPAHFALVGTTVSFTLKVDDDDTGLVVNSGLCTEGDIDESADDQPVKISVKVVSNDGSGTGRTITVASP